MSQSLNSGSMVLLAGIEGGGTKFKCAVATEDLKILRSKSIDTSFPKETLDGVKDFFLACQDDIGRIASIGIGCFGPAQVNSELPKYGHIETTPKQGWSNVDVLGFFKRFFHVPLAFDTDVNVAARSEFELGAAKDYKNFAYVTVGTGIGVSVYMGGNVAKGTSHFESGHQLVPRHPFDKEFVGVCDFHDDCIEGFASGPSIKKRWGKNPEKIPDDHMAWDIEGYYLGVLCVNLTLSYRPDRIILGGGVMNRGCLFKKIRQNFKALLGSYLEQNFSLDEFIVPAGMANDSGIKGALLLARSQISG
jgi:fructokinase